MSAKQQKKVKNESTPEPVKTESVEKKEQPAVETKKGGAKKPAVKNTETEQKKATSKKPATKTTKSSKSVKKTTTKKCGAKKEKSAEVTTTDKTVNSRTRFFKLLVDGEEAHGRFCGAKPKQAANKAFTSYSKTLEQVGGSAGPFKFSIVECTRGSKHKRYNYIGERIKLNKPMKVKIGSGPNAKEIEYNYNNRIMKDKTVVASA